MFKTNGGPNNLAWNAHRNSSSVKQRGQPSIGGANTGSEANIMVNGLEGNAKTKIEIANIRPGTAPK